jgi:hypothetical protein
MTMSTCVPLRLLPLASVLLGLSCGPQRDGQTAVAPEDARALDEDGDVERDLAPGESEGATASEPAAHIVFDAGDASTVPAEGVVAQPRRDPSPSFMGGIGYSPR